MSRNLHLPGHCRWGDRVGAAAGMSQFDYAADGRPRPATVVIRRKDGGIIGT